MVGVVVVEHPETPRRDEICSRPHALVHAAHPLAVVDGVHRVEAAEAAHEAGLQAVGGREARLDERSQAAAHQLVVGGRPDLVAGVAGEVAAHRGAVGGSEAGIHRLLLEHAVERIPPLREEDPVVVAHQLLLQDQEHEGEVAQAQLGGLLYRGRVAGEEERGERLQRDRGDDGLRFQPRRPSLLLDSSTARMPPLG